MSSDEQYEAGRTRLVNRVARLHRLVELNTPVTVMVTEVQMIMDALWLMNAESVGQSLASREGDRVAKAAGFVEDDEDFYVFTCKDGVATKHHAEDHGPMCGMKDELHTTHDLAEEVECPICFPPERT